jgi:hypothetical protein
MMAALADVVTLILTLGGIAIFDHWKWKKRREQR